MTASPLEGDPASAQTVYVVDDDPEVRDALMRLLRSFRVPVRTYSSAAAFLAEAPAQPAGCLVLDIRMPGASGLELQSALASWPHAPPIIFLTGPGTVSSSVSALKDSALYFLEEPVEDEKLMAAVRAAFTVDRRAREALDERRQAQARLATLTPHEREVLRHVIAGKLDRQVAVDLGTSEQAVALHRGRVMQKSGADSLPELVRIARLAEIQPATD